jgi:hypothetical protein
MKPYGWILLLLMVASPAWAAKKITVQQLQDLLQSLHQANKTDEEVATELEQVELTEQLTKHTMDDVASLVPGSLTTDQLYVLEARSATLIPPASDLPSTPPPDAAAQKALLDKAGDYVTRIYAQLPLLTATRTTFRFQDHLPAAVEDQGKHNGKAPGQPNGDLVIHYIGSTDTQVESQGGAEILSKVKDATQWGANNQIALAEQGPVLTTVLQEAQAAGKISWLRWETIYGRQTAVFSFAVDKKKSRYVINYCCFPDTEQEITAPFHTGGQVGVQGSTQTSIAWVPYKAIVPYHGELFIDAQTGIVVRLITEADVKPMETVHQEDTLIDYGSVTVNGKPVVVPVRSIVDTEVFPGMLDPNGRHIPRRTVFTAEYKDYK